LEAAWLLPGFAVVDAKSAMPDASMPAPSPRWSGFAETNYLDPSAPPSGAI
jgi:hypothetical protein